MTESILVGFHHYLIGDHTTVKFANLIAEMQMKFQSTQLDQYLAAQEFRCDEGMIDDWKTLLLQGVHQNPSLTIEPNTWMHDIKMLLVDLGDARDASGFKLAFRSGNYDGASQTYRVNRENCWGSPKQSFEFENQKALDAVENEDLTLTNLRER